MGDEIFKTLIQLLPDIVYKIDIAGNFTYVNDSVRKLGYKPEELIGQHFREIIHPDDINSVQRDLILKDHTGKKTALDETPKLFDERRTGKRISKKLIIRLVPKDWNNSEINSSKKVTYWEVLSLGLYSDDDENGKQNYIGTIGIIRDITILKKSEDAFLHSEMHYRAILENSTDVITIIATDGTILFESPSIKTLLGYDSIELIGINIFELIHPDDAKNVIRFLDCECRRSDPQYNIEYRFSNHNGEWSNMSSRVKKVLDDKGELMCFIFNSHDITERKIAEQALRESEELYRLLVETMNEGVGIIDNAGIITFVNSKITKILGNTSEDIIGHHINDFMNEENRKKIEARMSQRGKGRTDSFEIEWTGKDGRTIPTIVSPRDIFNSQGEHIGNFAVLSDAAEIKKNEENLIKASKIESLSIFAGGIAHDFNNLLTIIIGNLSVARMNMKESDKNIKILSEIEKASFKARDLTQQLFTFAKGGMQNKITTSIANLLKDATNFVLSGSNIHFEYNIPGDLHTAEVDQAQISQVLQNIVINSRQAMPEGGTITISAENVSSDEINIPSLLFGRYIKISIKDTGIGIPKENLSKIFDPYFSTKENGSGLGLAITYTIIAKHGGYINVDSTVGTGTIFTIYLPATRDKTEVKKESINQFVRGEGKILIMDDDEDIRKMVGAMIEQLGFNVKYAGDGEEAITLYKKAMDLGDAYKAVIMDLAIPGKMGGKEAISRLKEIDPAIKAIVSSGYSSDLIMSNYDEYGFCGAIAKPYRIKDLKEIFNKIFK